MAHPSKDKKIINTVRKTVLESVQGVLNDPDYGLPIKKFYLQKLERIRTRGGEKKLTSREDIRKKYL